MASLSQLYSSKESGLTTKKTFLVPLSEIYAEEGYNVLTLRNFAMLLLLANIYHHWRWR